MQFFGKLIAKNSEDSMLVSLIKKAEECRPLTKK